MQYPVNPEPDPKVCLLRLDMDIGCALRHGPVDDEVDQLHGRCFPTDFRHPRQFGFVEVYPSCELVPQGLDDLVVLGYGGEDVVLRGYGGADLVSGDDSQVVEGEHVPWVGHRDKQRSIAEVDGHEQVALGELARDGRDRLRIGLVLDEIDVLDADLLGHDRQHGALGRVPEVDHHAADARAGALVDLESVL